MPRPGSLTSLPGRHPAALMLLVSDSQPRHVLGERRRIAAVAVRIALRYRCDVFGSFLPEGPLSIDLPDDIFYITSLKVSRPAFESGMCSHRRRRSSVSRCACFGRW